jgi:hypothetical protein
MRALVLSGVLLSACGGDEAPEDDCAASDSCGSEGGSGSKSLLGDGASSYGEAHEATNGDSAAAEATQYVLETEQGIAIEASFESSSPTPDSFVFNSGALGSAGTPGFPGVDIQVLVGGKVLDSGVSLNLDSVQEFGYSSLLGNYFMNAALIRGKDYVLRVTPSASVAGKDYTIEIRGHVADK